MSYVITQRCIGVKDASCVQSCPVQCIHPTPQEADYERVTHLYINPAECIDCGACEIACPVAAIVEETALPLAAREWAQINAAYFVNEKTFARLCRLYWWRWRMWLIHKTTLVRKRTFQAS